jgi:hypothetical protein
MAEPKCLCVVAMVRPQNTPTWFCRLMMHECVGSKNLHSRKAIGSPTYMQAHCMSSTYLDIFGPIDEWQWG